MFLFCLVIFSITLLLITALLGWELARKVFHCTCACDITSIKWPNIVMQMSSYKASFSMEIHVKLWLTIHSSYSKIHSLIWGLLFGRGISVLLLFLVTFLIEQIGTVERRMVLWWVSNLSGGTTQTLTHTHTPTQEHTRTHTLINISQFSSPLLKLASCAMLMCCWSDWATSRHTFPSYTAFHLLKGGEYWSIDL